MKKTLLVIAIISMPSAAMAQDAMKMARATPDEVNWKTVSALPKGAEIAFLSGDPTKSDVIVERLKMPPNYQIPPHTHPYSETVTILSGRARLGFGDKVDPSATLDKSGTLYILTVSKISRKSILSMVYRKVGCARIPRNFNMLDEN